MAKVRFSIFTSEGSAVVGTPVVTAVDGGGVGTESRQVQQ